jgi:hypothetical protein
MVLTQRRLTSSAVPIVVRWWLSSRKHRRSKGRKGRQLRVRGAGAAVCRPEDLWNCKTNSRKDGRCGQLKTPRSDASMMINAGIPGHTWSMLVGINGCYLYGSPAAASCLIAMRMLRSQAAAEPKPHNRRTIPTTQHTRSTWRTYSLATIRASSSVSRTAGGRAAQTRSHRRTQRESPAGCGAVRRRITRRGPDMQRSAP